MNRWINQSALSACVASVDSYVIKTEQLRWVRCKFYRKDRQLHQMNEHFCRVVYSLVQRKTTHDIMVAISVSCDATSESVCLRLVIAYPYIHICA